MSEEFEISTNSYQLSHPAFDNVDRGIAKGSELRLPSMHGEVKIYTEQEVKDFNEERGLK